jgi:ferredoxin--NADP+ reductase
MSTKLKARMKRASLVQRLSVGSEDLGIFTFRPHEPLFSFRAGQFAYLGLDLDGEFVHRLYSITSSPYERKIMEFFILRIPGGQLTPHLFALKEGDEVFYMGPGGKFVLEKAEHNHLLMVSTGTGLAPFISMVRKIHADCRSGEKPFRDVTILQGVSYSRDLGYHDELMNLSKDRSSGFHYVATVSRPDEDEGISTDLCRGRVNDMVRHLLGEEMSGHVEPVLGGGLHWDQVMGWIPPEDTTVYVCGHPGMACDVEGVVGRHGYAQFIKEDYW